MFQLPLKVGGRVFPVDGGGYGWTCVDGVDERWTEGGWAAGCSRKSVGRKGVLACFAGRVLGGRVFLLALKAGQGVYLL